ncbi:TBC1 domain family member 14-like protein [Dinothrombium tinctorium]|uniref:TBC1 domain family member 14-like protein n=1 Tax=Dinothrombium tinctorium TaxID=1965070 RepID=A0A443QGQ9_9ACAR|nr:TBC1 domain family member 14-like protein [Dinothrombium tinctorium]
MLADAVNAGVDFGCNKNEPKQNGCDVSKVDIQSSCKVPKTKNGIVFPINELVNPTIDAVLNQVPLIYDPITKQLLLQSEFDELRLNSERNGCTKNLVLIDDHPKEKEFIHERKLDENGTQIVSNNDNLDVNNKDVVEKTQIDVDAPQNETSSNVFDDSDIESSPLPFLSSVYKPKKSSLSATFASASYSLSSSLHNVLNRLKKKNGINNETFATSTTALILENRPPHLPAKSIDEEVKHKHEYEEMVKEAKRKEAKDAKTLRKITNKRKKEEDRVIELIKVWQKDLLPNWSQVKNTKKVHDIWWVGIPPSIREKVWKLAIGNDLNLTHELYEICVSRSREKVWTFLTSEGESVADVIKLDVSRTFPHLGLFQENGPYHETLSQLLGAYVCYRPDISYVQGMSFLAGMLLLNMEVSDAFICLANLLNNQILMSFYRVDPTFMNAYYSTYQVFFRENLPLLYKHFADQQLTPDLYLMDWVYSLFSRSLPLDVSTHVWDLILRDGEEFIFRVALGILDMYKDILIKFDFINLAQYLTKLPDEIDSQSLFTSVAAIKMVVGNEKLTFNQVLSSFINSKV